MSYLNALFSHPRTSVACLCSTLFIASSLVVGGPVSAAELERLSKPQVTVESNALEVLLDQAVLDPDTELDADVNQYLRSLPATDVPVELLDQPERLLAYVSPEVRREQMAVTFDEHFQSEGYRFQSFEDCPVVWDGIELAAGAMVKWTLDADAEGLAGQSVGCWLSALHELDRAGDAFLVLDVQWTGKAALSSPNNKSMSVEGEGTGSVSVRLTTQSATLPMDRKSRLDASRLESRRDRQLLVVGESCDSDDCLRVIDVEVGGGSVQATVNVVGAFIAEDTPEKNYATASRAGGFVNGNFSSGGSGWSWRKRHGCNFTGPVHSDSPHASNGFAFLLGGNGSNSVATPNLGQMAQTVTVPPASYLDFKRRINLGRRRLASHPGGTTTLSVHAKNMTTGLTRRIYTESYHSLSQASTSYINKRVDVGAYGGHSVRFTFGACDAGHDSQGDTKGSVWVDNVEFQPKPIDRNARPTAGLWFDPSKDGQGIDIQKNAAGGYVVTWYTYDSFGQPVWYISDTKNISNGLWQAALFRSTWNPATETNSLTTVGSIAFEMYDSKTIRFYWDFYSSGISSWDGTAFYTHFFGGQSATGIWYEPTASGWGLTVANQSSSLGPDSVVTIFLYQGTQPVWVQGTLEGTPSNGASFAVRSFFGTNLCPSCSGTPSTSSSGVGNATLSLGSASGTSTTNITLPSGHEWDRIGSSLLRLTAP